ncbi:MAG: hypothetical protein QME66_10125 [Candidatus Eisenbacteria bacterium]|nr:hypothetical protein [Candidatus Eisenbacteria bacterium]
MHSPIDEKGSFAGKLRETLLSGKKHYLKRTALRGVLRAVSLALFFFLAALLVEISFPGNRAVETLLFLLILLSSFWALVNLVFLPLARMPNLEGFAHLLDKTLRDRRNTFLNALLLGNAREKLKATASTQMIDKVLSDVSGLATPSRVRAPGDGQELRGPGRNAILALLIVLVLFVLFPSRIPTLAMRILSPSYSPGQVSILKVLPGDCSVPRGATFNVEALTIGGTGFPTLRFRSGVSQFSSKTMQELPGEGREDVKRFGISLGEVFSDLEYEVRFGGKKSKLYNVDVLEPIRPVAFKMKYLPPGYTGLDGEEIQSSTGDISALKGTAVTLDVTTNERCERGTIQLGLGKEVELKSISSRVLRATFGVVADDSYVLRLADPELARQKSKGSSLSGEQIRAGEDLRGSSSGTVPGAIVAAAASFKYKITALADNPPFVKIVEPSDDIELPREMRFPVVYEVADDFGISALSVVWEKKDGPGGRAAMPPPQGKGGNGQFPWNLSSIEILPGDTLTYFLEARDNDMISGPKVGQSERRRVRFPTLGEMLEVALGRQEESRRSIEEIAKEERELKKFFDETNAGLKKTGQLSWEQRKGIEKAVAREKELQEKIRQASKDIEEAMQSLSSRDVLQEQIVQKVMEIQELLRDIGSRELKETLEKISEALSRMDLGQVRKSLDEMRFSREDLLKALERTAELLRRVQLEEKLDVASRMAERLQELQKAINKRVEEISNEEELSSLLDEQSRVEREAAELERLLGDLASSLQESAPSLAEKLREMNESLCEQGEIEKALAGMKASLSSCSGGNCKGWGLKLEREFARMSMDLQSAQEQFGQKMKEEVVREMRGLGHDLVSLSKKQEDLLSKGPEVTTSDLATDAQESFELTGRAGDKLFEISKKTMLVTGELVSQLGNAIVKLDEARMAFDSGRTTIGRTRVQEARTSLDKAVVALLRTESSIQSASSAIGMKEAMQRLGALTAMQEQLNSSAEGLDLSELGHGRLRESVEEAMARLAAEQEMIREGIEELSEKVSQETNLKKNLSKISEEMKKIVENFEKKEFDESTLERQKKVLTRLLDAQRSVRKEDYTKQRFSRPGQDVARKTPPPVPAPLLSPEERMRVEILKGRGERFPLRYRALVEKYFESLSARAR